MTLKEKVLKMKTAAEADKAEAWEMYKDANKRGNELDAQAFYNDYKLAIGEIRAYREVLYIIEHEEAYKVD